MRFVSLITNICIIIANIIIIILFQQQSDETNTQSWAILSDSISGGYYPTGRVQAHIQPRGKLANNDQEAERRV